MEDWVPWTEFDPWNYNTEGKSCYRCIRVGSTNPNLTLAIPDSQTDSKYGTMIWFGPTYPVCFYVSVFGTMSVLGNPVNGTWHKLAFADHSHSWDSITGKPSTFAPSGHIHAYTDIIGGPTFSLSGTTLTISC